MPASAEEVAAIEKEGINIDFLTTKMSYEVAREHLNKKPCPNKNVIVYSAPFDNRKNTFIVYLSRIVKNILISSKFKNKYDIIIAPNYLPQNLIPAIFLKKNSKLVAYFHTTPPFVRKEYLKISNPEFRNSHKRFNTIHFEDIAGLNRTEEKELKKNFLRRVISSLNWQLCVFLTKNAFDLVFVINNVTRTYFIEKGFSPERVITVTNGIHYDEILDIKPKKKEFDGVFLGRLVQNKGIFDLLKIWKIVTEKFPSSKLCVIGDGFEKANLSMKIKEEKLEENIILVGQKEGNEKYNLMKKSKVFVYPSYYESQGVVLMEAIACNLAVVAYYLPTYEEFFGGNIMTVKIGSTKDMANKILEVLDSSKQENNDYINFIGKYNWEETANKQIRCIENLVKRNV